MQYKTIDAQKSKIFRFLLINSKPLVTIITISTVYGLRQQNVIIARSIIYF